NVIFALNAAQQNGVTPSQIHNVLDGLTNTEQRDRCFKIWQALQSGQTLARRIFQEVANPAITDPKVRVNNLRKIFKQENPTSLMLWAAIRQPQNQVLRSNLLGQAIMDLSLNNDTKTIFETFSIILNNPPYGSYNLTLAGEFITAIANGVLLSKD